jgi:hypothetical protein
MRKKKNIVEESIDAAELVGRVALRATAITAKTAVKVTGSVAKGTIKGVKKINQKIKDHSDYNQD